MNDKDLKRITNDLAMLEAHLQQAAQIATRLKQRLDPAASGSSSRKGLSSDQRAELTAKRKRNILKRSGSNN